VGPAVAAVPHRSIDAFPSVIEGRDGWLYLGADVSSACVPARTLTGTLMSLRRLRTAVEASGRQFVLVVAPDKTTMVPEHLPADYLGRDCSSRAKDEFWRRVVAEAGAIDLRPALTEIAQRKGSPVYYPADTHWSQEGGLAMTYALADRVEPGITRTWHVAPTGSIRWPDPETAAAAPQSAGELLAGGKVVAVQVAERNLLSGTSPILLDPVITELAHALARHPPP
jgi:hypothetical protein